MGGHQIHWEQNYVGDNKEFTVGTAGEIIVYFVNQTSKTASDDDPTNGNYYFTENQKHARKYVLRTDQTIRIIEENATIFTDPITVAIGDGTVIPASGLHKEEYDSPILYKLKIDVLTANTNLKIRKY